MNEQTEQAWASAGMRVLLAQTNAEIVEMEAARSANTIERAALIAAARAASAGHAFWPKQKPTGSATASALYNRHRNLQTAELDANLHELRIIALLPGLDAKNALDYAAGGYEGSPEVLYYNDAAVARKATLEDANEALFA